MRKNFILLVVLGVVSVAFVDVSWAQLIDYNRRAKRQEIKAVASVAPKVKTHKEGKKAKDHPMKPYVSKPVILSPNVKVLDIISSNPNVSTRIERIYDMDRDGRLQKDEILEFFSDVVDSVKKKGRFLVSSDLLKFFDENSDGKISRYESLAIKKLLK